MALMAAEELGIDPHDIRPVVGDTEAVGFTDVTEGSRATFATGMAWWRRAADGGRAAWPGREDDGR